MNEYVQYIIDNISSDLTGIYEKDMEHLHQCSEKYKNDEDAPEILREIAAMMYRILPETEKDHLSEKLEGYQGCSELEFETVKDMIQSGDIEKAKCMMEGILESISGLFEEDDENIYLSLNHIMELYVYNYYFTPQKELKCTDIRYNEYYRTYGQILAQLGDHAKAEEAYRTAAKWNPVDLDSILGLGEIFKFQGKLEDYFKLTKQAYRFCCTRATMARFYRNMAYYFLETYKPEVARALYVYSNIYYQTDNAEQELAYLEKAVQTQTPEYTLKELQEILAANEIELGPDSVTIGIVYRVGQIFLEDGDRERAKDCFSIVYDITQDEETGEILNGL